MKNRLVVVSNRLADLHQPAAGGLAVALGAALRKSGGVWMGWSGKTAHEEADEAPTRTCAERVEYLSIDLTEAEHAAYYRGYANGMLWPALHQRIDLADFNAGFEEGYWRVSRKFARALMPTVRSDDLIWIHDYHLIPLASELRALGCNNRIGFFLHTPLPPVATLTAIPRHELLISSLLACDVLGFQSHEDLKNFKSYVEGVLNGTVENDCVRMSGASIRIGVFPIGIDVSAFRALTHSPVAQAMCDSTRLEYARRKLLIGVDRLDYSKGLPQRIKAFRECLQSFPECRHSATLIQIASPSREDVEAYTDIQHELEALCGAINGDFGELDWVPVRYIHRTLGQAQLAGLYRAARVALVTPLRDGMNLVAKEFVAAQDPDDPGVLVLSRFAGAAEQLKAALLVNPHDVESTATTIRLALNMPLSERRSRHSALIGTVERYDLHWWCESFLTALREKEISDSSLLCATH